MKLKAIDLFCGAGGLSYGLKQAGIEVVAGIDVDESCRYAYEHNVKAEFINISVRDVTGKQLNKLWGKHDKRLLAGCAPCQPFSSQRKGAAASSHEAWNLLDEFGRLVQETTPDYVTMENVAPLKSQEIFARFVRTLEEVGYSVDYKVVRTEQYGLPQRRRRLVLVASKSEAIFVPDPTVQEGKEITVKAALKGLPRLGQGEVCSRDRLHRSRALSPLNQKRMRASKPGGTWRDWPEELLAPCHKRASGKTFQSFYGRMDPDQPSPTITTEFYNYGSGRFGHPSQDRTITPREAAILQGFPRDYDFVPPDQPVYLARVGKMIGNAVPPVIGEIVGAAMITA
ncbi:MAG: DNA cytosine methyltransferase [Mobiluncus porci]|uniref:DNA cytosine methyltransferase n=1 Tax=Mobiluncus porci TaxID=2652278 RepID=UPI0023F2FEC3|nr:DNA cytosine methyltransferase [Mobiluncus porci]MDD7540770.1 DNA cytosine methyltransferase [Mobiluncus porci]MDY5748332.1 DNA cytosine methyltransferase [Mobiluncus porci]